MNTWLDWFSKLILQPRSDQDERVATVETEVADLKRDMRNIKERTEALEAIHRVAGG